MQHELTVYRPCMDINSFIHVHACKHKSVVSNAIYSIHFCFLNVASVFSLAHLKQNYVQLTNTSSLVRSIPEDILEEGEV